MKEKQIRLFGCIDAAITKQSAVLRRQNTMLQVRPTQSGVRRQDRWDLAKRRKTVLRNIERLLATTDKIDPNNKAFPKEMARTTNGHSVGPDGSDRHDQIVRHLGEGIRTVFTCLFPAAEEDCGFQRPGNGLLEMTWLRDLPEWKDVPTSGRRRVGRKYPDLAFTYRDDIVLIEIGKVETGKWDKSWWIRVDWDGRVQSRNHQQMDPYWGGLVDAIPVWIEGCMQPLSRETSAAWDIIDYGVATYIEQSELAGFILETVFPSRDITVLEQRLQRQNLMYLYFYCFALTWIDCVGGKA